MTTTGDHLFGDIELPPGYVAKSFLDRVNKILLAERPKVVPPGEGEGASSSAGETELVEVRRVRDFTGHWGTDDSREDADSPDSEQMKLRMLRRLCREVCSLKFFRECPHTVDFLDFYLGGTNTSQDLYFVTSHAPMSLTLHDLLTRPEPANFRSKLQEAHIRWMMCQILCGAYTLHQSGCWHLDLSLRNCIVSAKTLECRISGFNLSRAEREDYDLKGEVPDQQGDGTDHGHEVISLEFRAPEKILECGPYTNAIDVWGCGVTLAHLLTGSTAFLRDDTGDVSRQLYRIFETFAGFPTREKLKYFEKRGANKFTLKSLRSNFVRDDRLRTVEAQLKVLEAVPLPLPPPPAEKTDATAESSSPMCVYCGQLSENDTDLLKIDSQAAGGSLVMIHPLCVSQWVESENEKPEVPQASPITDAEGNPACVQCQQVLEENDDGTKTSFVILVDGRAKAGCHLRCIVAFRIKILQHELNALKTFLSSKPLPEPQDVGKVVQEAGKKEGKTISASAAAVLSRMLVFDSVYRASIREVLQMPWWREDPRCQALVEETFIKKRSRYPNSVDTMDAQQLQKYLRGVVTMDPFGRAIIEQEVDNTEQPTAADETPQEENEPETEADPKDQVEEEAEEKRGALEETVEEVQQEQEGAEQPAVAVETQEENNPDEVFIVSENCEPISVSITEVTNGNTIWLQPQDEDCGAKYEEICELVAGLAENEPHPNPQKDEIVGAYYEADASWLRAKVTSDCGGAMEVLFLDYGTKANVATEDLRQLPPDEDEYNMLRTEDPLAFEVKLAYLKPLEEEDEHWQENAVSISWEFAEKEGLQAWEVYQDESNRQYCSVADSSGKTLSVSLLEAGVALVDKKAAAVDSEGAREALAAQKVAKENHRAMWEFGSVDDEPVSEADPEDQVEEEVEKADATEEAAKEQQVEEQEQGGVEQPAAAVETQENEPVTEAENNPDVFLVSDNREPIDVSISAVTNGNTIWLQPQDDELGARYEEICELVAGLAENEPHPNPQRDELVGAYHKPYESWLRARVTSDWDATSPKSLEVIFLDFGTKANVATKDLRQLPSDQDEYEKLKTQDPLAIEVKLAYLKPVEEEDEQCENAAVSIIGEFAEKDGLHARKEYTDGSKRQLYYSVSDASGKTLSDSLLEAGVALVDKKVATVDSEGTRVALAAQEVAEEAEDEEEDAESSAVKQAEEDYAAAEKAEEEIAAAAKKAEKRAAKKAAAAKQAEEEAAAAKQAEEEAAAAKRAEEERREREAKIEAENKANQEKREREERLEREAHEHNKALRDKHEKEEAPKRAEAERAAAERQARYELHTNQQPQPPAQQQQQQHPPQGGYNNQYNQYNNQQQGGHQQHYPQGAGYQQQPPQGGQYNTNQQGGQQQQQAPNQVPSMSQQQQQAPSQVPSMAQQQQQAPNQVPSMAQQQQQAPSQVPSMAQQQAPNQFAQQQYQQPPQGGGQYNQNQPPQGGYSNQQQQQQQFGQQQKQQAQFQQFGGQQQQQPQPGGGVPSMAMACQQQQYQDPVVNNNQNTSGGFGLQPRAVAAAQGGYNNQQPPQGGQRRK